MDELDSLDRQLQEAAPYIDDAGFTAGVLAKLPAPRRQHQSLRAIILLGVTLLASVLAYVLSDGASFVRVNVARVTQLPLLWVLSLALASGLLVTAGGCFAALSKMRELRLR